MLTTNITREHERGNSKNMRELEPIIKYKMSPMESKAYKIALAWQDECGREIPNEQYSRLKENSDPRKSLLFKYCFKLAKEATGILSDPEMPMYVRAQIQILKSINDGKVHALIEPHCLVGDKAWRRWKLWKSRYDKIMARSRPNPEGMIAPSRAKAKAEIRDSFEFLSSNSLLDRESLMKRSDDFARWIKCGSLSCFYATLSPWFRDLMGDPNLLEFDYHYYRAASTPEIERFFRETFAHEFKKENETCQEA